MKVLLTALQWLDLWSPLGIITPGYALYMMLISTLRALLAALYGDQPVVIAAIIINIVDLVLLSPLTRLALGGGGTIVVLVLVPAIALCLHRSGKVRRGVA